MKALWLNISERYTAFSQREKVLVLISGLVLVLMVGSTWVVEPAFNRWLAAREAQQQLVQQLGEYEQQQLQLQQRLKDDPNDELRRQIQLYQFELTQLEEQLRHKSLDLIGAREMAATLGDILGSTKQIKLLQLNSIPPKSVLIQSQGIPGINNGSLADVNLFQHGVKITLQGRYFDILDVFRRIEALPRRLFWKKLDYKVTNYPLAEVEFEIYTLSTGKEFISV